MSDNGTNNGGHSGKGYGGAVLAKSSKVIVDTHGATAPIILPSDAFRPKAPAPDTQTASPGASQ